MILRTGKRTLFIAGGMFWVFGGLFVLRTGLMTFWAVQKRVWIVAGALAVFFFFYFFIFRRLAERHVRRINALADERPALTRLFDGRTYLLIAVMSAGGVLLRRFGLLPDAFVAAFYPGLGAALALRGALYAAQGGRAVFT